MEILSRGHTLKCLNKYKTRRKSHDNKFDEVAKARNAHLLYAT
jgi:hypothetical protein